MEILVTVGYVALCVLLFSFSIAIHEFGHFIVALKLGFKVERFSIGFGPALWKKTFRGVEYRLSAIPFGGYVSIPDVDPEGARKLEGGAAPSSTRRHAPWEELLVALAGPFMNVVFAAVLAVALACMPSARFGRLPAVIGEVVPGGPAERGGLKSGDEVLSVGGREVASWTDMLTEIQFASSRPTVFRVRRDGGEVELTLTPETAPSGATYIKAVSVSDERAQCAMWMAERNPLKQLWWDAGAVFRALKGLVTPREMKATGKALGGPVMIAKGTYVTIRRNTADGLGFLRFINTNLAVMNLLPIPVLDGGLILFSLIAIIFRRRLPEKVVNPLTTAFMYLLLGLMVFLAGRDCWRLGRFGQSDKAPPAAETQGGGE